MTSVVEALNVLKPSCYLIEMDEKTIASFPSYKGCPVCKSENNYTTVAKMGAEQWHSTVDLVMCKNCEHIYYRNPPSETYILNYYQNTWMKNYRKANKKLFTLPSKGISYKISEILVDLNYENKNATIVDIGCGHGNLMAGLISRGFESTYGCEQSPDRANATEIRFPGHVFSCGYYDIPEHKNFDIIYSNHVVEHIHNPTEFFKWATTRVNENGLIIINVPDADYETAQDTLLYLPHLHSFTAKSLECLGRQHDYQLLLWIKGDHNELCGIFYKHLTVNLDKNKFLTVMQKQRMSSEQLIKKLRAPWLETSKRKSIWITYPVGGMLTDSATQEKSYVKLNCVQAYYLVSLAKINSLLLKLKLKRLAIRLRLLLKLISRKNAQINTFGYLKLSNKPTAGEIPQVGFKNTLKFLIK